MSDPSVCLHHRFFKIKKATWFFLVGILISFCDLMWCSWFLGSCYDVCWLCGICTIQWQGDGIGSDTFLNCFRILEHSWNRLGYHSLFSN